jgi:hypothetical protein
MFLTLIKFGGQRYNELPVELLADGVLRRDKGKGDAFFDLIND